jgi:hypothetical protein
MRLTTFSPNPGQRPFRNGWTIRASSIRFENPPQRGKCKVQVSIQKEIYGTQDISV